MNTFARSLLAASLLLLCCQPLAQATPAAGWLRAPEAPFAGYTATAIDSAGHIYTYNFQESSTPSGESFYSYVARTGQWRKLVPPRTMSGCSALIALPGWVYCFSVSTATPASPNRDNAYVYQVATGRWHAIAPSPSQHAGGAATRGRDDLIYLVAGGATSWLSGALDVYNPQSHAWQQRASMGYGSSQPAATTGQDGRIYVMGGVAVGPAGAIYVANALEAYDPHTNRWTSRAPMPTARAGLAAVTGSDGGIYAIGGTLDPIGFLPRNGITRERSLTTVEVYDPHTNRWSTGPSLHVARWGLGAVATPDGQIYVIGGISSAGKEVGTVEAYTVPTSLPASTR